MTIVIDGKSIAQKLEVEVLQKTLELKNKNIQPSLAVILVGNNPASQIYVQSKKKKAESLGIKSADYILNEKISQNELIGLIHQLNNDKSVHGILLQLPLPSHIDQFQALIAINPLKDVDGFHPENVGLLGIGKPRFIPCTPKGCIKLIHSVNTDISGLNALIVGRSNIVGFPVAKLLLDQNCTVQIAHSKTKNLKELCLQSDIIVAATGKTNLITHDMISPSRKTIIIDVGINRYFDENEQKNKIKGDVDFTKIYESGNAYAITPVPGGVGPMTIACLMENLIHATEILSGNSE